jgi:hypothetical protein
MKQGLSTPDKTILTISTSLIILFLLVGWKWLLYTSLVNGLVGIFSPYISRRIDWLWMKLAWTLSLVIPKIILTIIFYLFLFPIATLAKIFRKSDPLMLKNTSISTFKVKDKSFDKASFQKLW